jgi:arylformamidase
MSVDEYRAEFDATVTFANGGGLRAEGFRVDVPGPYTGEDEVAALFIASLSLLLVDRVELRGLRIFREPHKGTRGGPSDAGRMAPGEERGWRWVELSHVITAGMTTYPGLPAPEVAPYLTREASRDVYAASTEFAIDRVTMVGNTGTYLDSPLHRFAGGVDLAGLPLSSLADLAAVVVRTVGGTATRSRAVDVGALAALDVADRAVLLHTGGDRHWGTPDYTRGTPPTSPRRVPPGSSSTARVSSASTQRTSTTSSAADRARRTASCSPRASRSSNISPAWISCRPPARASPPHRRASRTSARSPYGLTPPSPRQRDKPGSTRRPGCN